MNELKYRPEFLSVLANYKLSPVAMDILRRTRLVLLAGPTSSGRNTIINELIKTGDYYHIVSDTTRLIRVKDGLPTEENGREYWFRSEQEMLAGLRRGQYIEAAIIHNQQVSGCNYRELAKAIVAKKIAIKDIEQVGAQTIHELYPDATIIFIIPPSFEAWMKRLRGRGDLPADEIQRRLISAREELTAALEHNYYRFVINENIIDTVAEVSAIAGFGLPDLITQRRSRQLAERLNLATKNYLLSKET